MNGTANSTTGWNSSPNGRGTKDIIVSCLSTIILCCWTVVCPNLPALGESRWTHLRDKFDLACIGLLGPEFLLGIASGQMASAKRSVERFKNFKKPDQPEWTLAHAFFADMGGFILKDPNLPHAFPVNAEQLAYLIENEIVDHPTIEKEDIDDRNKVDGLARLLAIGQSLWFMISTIARPLQGLSMTTFELTTLSFIVVTFATSYCWMHKPSDVIQPVELTSSTPNSPLSVAEIKQKWEQSEHLAVEEDDCDPLYFLKGEKFLMDKIWRFYVHILHKVRIPLFSRPIQSRPHNRFRGDNMPPTEISQELIAGIFIAAFSATFIGAWNFYFPTQIERTIWRIASIYNIVFAAFGGAYTWVWHQVFWERHQSHKRPTRIRLGGSQRARYVVDRVENEVEKARRVPIGDGQWTEIPIRLLLPVTAVSALYCLFRGYILIEDIIGLRSVPVSVFGTVEWAEYIPHL